MSWGCIATRVSSRLLLLALASGASVAGAAPEEEDDTCTASGGDGCAGAAAGAEAPPRLPVYPDCEYSCDETPYIGPNSGNTRRIWPECPAGPGGCQDCQDRNPSCGQFAAAYNGYGCEDNPSFMIDVCARACNTCHLRDHKTRCGEVLKGPPALKPGDINATFQRILAIPSLQAEVLSDDPWIVRIPNFLSDEEVAFLRNTDAFGLQWKEASDTGALDEFGRARMTFSANRRTGVLWCNYPCHNHTIAKQVRSRIGEIVRVHPHYFEHFQFLRYTEGQYYKAHHDAAGTRPQRGDEVPLHRIYTFFLYLNDVPQGGETEFPDLGIKVKPSKGSAILWPSVLDGNPYAVDRRTRHAALPVEAGVKYSMNIWVHLGPFTLAHYLACTGSPID